MAPPNRTGFSDENSDDSSNSQVVPKHGKKQSSRRSKGGDKHSDEYKKRRERNNIAVKRSRTKSKQKTMETLQRVNQLRADNDMLESKIKLLTKELSFLKDLFLAHAGSAHGQNLNDIDLSMLSEEGAMTPVTSSSSSASAPTASNTASLPAQQGWRDLGLDKDHEYAVKPEMPYYAV